MPQSDELPFGLINPDQWAKFYDCYWKKKPFVLRQAFEHHIFDDDHIKNAIAGARASDFTRFYASTSKPEPLPKTFWHISKSDRSALSYLKRIRVQNDLQEYGLIITHFHNYDPNINRMTHSWANYFHKNSDPFDKKFDLVLFLSSYTHSPFGLHCDPYELFCFVLRGKKTMAAFDPMAFGPQAQEVAKQGRPDGGIKREQFASRRSDSLVLQAELGDILYLPAFFWHFVYGNPTEPTFSAHLIIGDSSSRLLDSVHVEPCSA